MDELGLVQSTFGNSSHSTGGIKFDPLTHPHRCPLSWISVIAVLHYTLSPIMSSTEAEPRLSQPGPSTASLGAKVAGVTAFGVTVKTYQNLIQKRHPLSGESASGASGRRMSVDSVSRERCVQDER